MHQVQRQRLLSLLNQDSVLWKVSLPKILLTIDPDAENKALLVQTKRCVLYIIRVQQGKNLMEILVKYVTEDDERKWQQLIREEIPNQKGHTTHTDTLFYDLAEYCPSSFGTDPAECRMRR